MVDLILEYGNRGQYPKIPLTSNQVNLFCKSPLPPYFDIDSTNDLIIKRAFFYNQVEDIHRYDLRYINRKWILCKPNSSTVAEFFESQTCCGNPRNLDRPISPDKNNILIILESPHMDEYCQACMKALASANGATGLNFHKYFTEFILGKCLINRLSLSLNINEVYSICFVNPIPLQTSLYQVLRQAISSDIRDSVWKQLFPSPC